MGKVFQSVEPQAGDSVNTLLGRILQKFGGLPNWGDSDNILLSRLLLTLGGDPAYGASNEALIAGILQQVGPVVPPVPPAGNVSGAGSPVGVVTPDFVGQFYTNTVDDSVWEATGLTSADWTQTQSLPVSWTPTSYDLRNAFGYATQSVNWPGVTSITFKQQSSLSGFSILSQTTLQTLSFPNLTTSAGRLTVSSNTVLTSFSVPLLASMTGGFGLTFFGNTVLSQAVFPLLASVAADLAFQSNPALTLISFPALTTHPSPTGMMITGNTLLTTLNFPVLVTLATTTNTISSNPALTAISFPSVVNGGRFTIDSNAALTSISFPLMTGILGSNTTLLFTNNSLLTSINVASLVSSGHTIQITGNTILPTISFPAYTTAGGGFTFSSNPALTSISFPVVTSIAGAFTANGDTLLTSVSLPSLITLGGTMTLTTDPALASLVLTNYVPTNGRIHTITGAALTDTSVNLLLARAVANGAYVSGTINTSGGTSSAPTGAGVADKATLIARGVTVTTN